MHSMSVDEMLAGKEERIEANVYARAHGRAQTGGPHDDRIVQARAHVRGLRELIAETRLVDLTSVP
jgi:hypothetical protein